MKKVLVYGLKDPIGGVEKILFEYVSCMVNGGYDITFDFIIFSERFSIETEINALGCRVIYLPSKKNNYVGYKRKLMDLFENNKYCAVWGNYSGLTNIDLLSFAKKYNVPIRIAHSHVAKLYWGHPIIKIIGSIFHFINKARLPLFATHYWACSKEAGEFMFPKSTHNKLTVINNAINTEIFNPERIPRNEIRKKLSIEEDSVVIGHIGRMCAAKNQIFLLNIMNEIKKINPKSKLLFIGDGELKQVLLDTAEKIGITDDVIFAGHRNDCADLLCAVDVFVLPSFSEGFGLCVIEAQSSGVPCVVSDVVPKTVDLTGAVKFLSLKLSESEWADAILKQSKITIDSPAEKISAHGFEIQSQAQKLYSVFNGGKI